MLSLRSIELSHHSGSLGSIPNDDASQAQHDITRNIALAHH
jgi:hypothetical protein